MSRAKSQQHLLEAFQRALRMFLNDAGCTPNVDGQNTKLHKIFQSESTRTVRQWCGIWVDRWGVTKHYDRLPHDVERLGKFLDLIIKDADSSKRAQLKERAASLCNQLSLIRPGSQQGVIEEIVAMANTDAVVKVLERFLKCGCERNGNARLHVVTTTREAHPTVSATLVGMIVVIEELARTGHKIDVRVIERGAQLRVAPVLTADRVGEKVQPLVASMNGDLLMSWHGSLVSTDGPGGEQHIGAIVGWGEDYCVLDRSSGLLNVARELHEKHTDFERAWSALVAKQSSRLWLGEARAPRLD